MLSSSLAPTQIPLAERAAASHGDCGFWSVESESLPAATTNTIAGYARMMLVNRSRSAGVESAPSERLITDAPWPAAVSMPLITSERSAALASAP